MPAAPALPSELTIYAVGALRETWLAWLAEEAAAPAASQPAACTLDGAAVAEVDGAGLQLLLSVSHTLAGAGRALRIAQPSAALLRACDAFGVRGRLVQQQPGDAA